MICGLVLKYLNMSGLVMIGRYETNLPFTSQFPLTLPVRTQQIGHDDMRSTKAPHYFSEEFQCRFAIPALGNIAFQHLTFVIYGPPYVKGLAVDLHENFVQVPLPV